MSESEAARKHRRVANAVKHMLKELDYDLENQDLRDTPKRVAKLLEGYVTPPGGPPELRVFESNYSSLITVVDHRAYTKCPHHLETVEMDMSISYVPNGKLLGVSKLARVADYFAKGLMLQEEVAELVVDGIMQALEPLGIAVFIEGRHMCIRSRGVKSYNSNMCTTVVKGVFKEDIKAREEFFNTILISRMGRR